MVTHRIGPIDVGASHGGDPKDPNDRIYNDGLLATQGLWGNGTRHTIPLCKC